MNKKCYVCSSESLINYKYKKEILSCDYCQHSFLNTDSIEVSNLHFEQGEYLNWRIRNKEILASIARERVKFISSFIQTGNVLEIGCSTGETLQELRKNGFRVTGVDLSDDALKICKERGFDCFTSLEEASNGEKFDLIISFHVIEHIEKIQEHIDTCRACLNDGGLIYLRLPNMNDLARSVFKEKWTGFEPGHIQFFSPRSMEFFLKKKNFNIVKLTSAGHIRPWIGGLRRLFLPHPTNTISNGMPSDKLYRYLNLANRIIHPLLAIQNLFCCGSEMVVVGKYDKEGRSSSNSYG